MELIYCVAPCFYSLEQKVSNTKFIYAFYFSINHQPTKKRVE